MGLADIFSRSVTILPVQPLCCGLHGVTNLCTLCCSSIISSCSLGIIIIRTLQHISSIRHRWQFTTLFTTFIPPIDSGRVNDSNMSDLLIIFVVLPFFSQLIETLWSLIHLGLPGTLDVPVPVMSEVKNLCSFSKLVYKERQCFWR